MYLIIHMVNFMEKKLLDKNQYRYEKKFSFSNLLKSEVLNLIKVHPSQLREVFNERKVNSIYFDNYNFESYTDSISGIMNRNKEHRPIGGAAEGDPSVFFVSANLSFIL